MVDEDVAGAHNVRPAEEHEAIAVGVRGGLMNHLDALAVEVKILFVGIGVGGPGARGIRGLIAILRAHSVEQGLVRDHGGALSCIGDVARNVAAHDGATEARDLLVAADMVGMHVRVDRCNG